MNNNTQNQIKQLRQYISQLPQKDNQTKHILNLLLNLIEQQQHDR